MPQTKNPNYRPDIDGLRAVAVLLVVLFHAGLGFPGGYVGVDVFFVISGYLITGIIVREVESERGFSLARFWQRRIHRILPPVAAMVLVVLLIGPFLMRPGDLEALAKSAIAQTFMAANVRFARMPTGYFDTSSDLWPLLHTWSLAVEEQFYLFYPIVLAFLLRRSRKTSAWFVWVVIAISLAGSLVLTPIKPEWSFYLLPTRAWELGLGAALAIRPLRPLHATLSNAVSLLGIGMILASSWIFDAETPFPGWQAIVPCLGAAMVVGTRSASVDLDRPWLSNRLMVGIGLVSYSLYLWHWPVLAYLRYYFGIHLDLALTAIAIVVMTALSISSYRWVESPLRRMGNRCHIRTSFAGAMMISVVVLIAAVPIWRTDGLNSGLRAAANSAVPASQFSRLEGEFIGTSKSVLDFAILGDSHASAATSFIFCLAEEAGVHGVSFTRSGTAPLVKAYRPAEGVLGEQKSAWLESTLHRLGLLKPRFLILICRWTEYLEGNDSRAHVIARPGSSDPESAMMAGLQSVIAACHAWGGKVVILQQAPRLSEGIERRIFVRQLWSFGVENEAIGSVETAQRQHRRANKILQDLSSQCRVIAPIMGDLDRDSAETIVLYRDDDHLSDRGVDFYFGESLRDVFRAMTE